MEQHLTFWGIIAAWEVGVGRRPLDRALAMLWAAGTPGNLAALPLVQRDKYLLETSAATFGPKLSALASCPDCGEELEMEFEAEALAALLPGVEDSEIVIGGQAITLRPITSADLAEAVQAPEADVPDLLRNRLIDRQSIPTSLWGELDARIEAREAEGELTTRLTCVSCQTVWSEVLDITAFLWAEIETTALRLLGEIAEISAALGWSERDILALSEPRRQAYLAIVRQP